MIDNFFKWTDENAAKSDALAAAEKFQVNARWLQDHVLPNVKSWRPSQDTIVNGLVVHNYLIGWFAIVSTKNQVPALLNASALQFALDRDGPPYIVRNNIGAVITDVAVAPIFCGSHYPLGGYT